jgi:IS30 family transposase
MKTHHKLTSQERDKIAYWHAIGESIREISRRIERSPSSISDELTRNKVDGIYHSIYAHKATEVRKRRSHKNYLLKTRPTLKAYVVEKLQLGWSREQIAGRLGKEITDRANGCPSHVNTRYSRCATVAATLRGARDFIVRSPNN